LTPDGGAFPLFFGCWADRNSLIFPKKFGCSVK